MSQKEQKKLLRLANLTDKGTVGVLEEFDALDEQIEALEAKSEEALSIVKAVQKEEGPQGPEPTEEKLLELIAPLIPDPIPGPTYMMTMEDKIAIAGLIKVPVVEQRIETVIEKIEVIREQPIVTNEIKEVEVAITEQPEVIADKLNTLKEVLDPKVLKGWKEFKERVELSLFNPTMGPSFADLENLRRLIGSSTNSGGGFTSLTATGTVDGSNATFTFSVVPTYIVADGVWFRRVSSNSTVFWTIAGTTVTMINPPAFDIFGVA